MRMFVSLVREDLCKEVPFKLRLEGYESSYAQEQKRNTLG